MQAALTHKRWLGYADSLVRVEEPCPRWGWSYEPWHAKLSRSARPEHLLQISLYDDLLGAVQGRAAERGALMRIVSSLMPAVGQKLRSGNNGRTWFSLPVPASLRRYHLRFICEP